MNMDVLVNMEVFHFLMMFQFLLEYGFSDLDIINIIKRVPYLLDNYYLEGIGNKIDYFEEREFKEEEIILIMCNNPYVLTYSIDLLDINLKSIKDNGFSDDDVRSMLVDNPIILSYDIKSLKEKFDYYKEIGIKDYLVSNSKGLRISLDLVRGRYTFLKKLGLDNNDWWQDLFLTDLKFLKKYNISKEELLKEAR